MDAAKQYQNAAKEFEEQADLSSGLPEYPNLCCKAAFEYIQAALKHVERRSYRDASEQYRNAAKMFQNAGSDYVGHAIKMYSKAEKYILMINKTSIFG